MTSRLLVPYPNPTTEAELRFNIIHGKKRVHVENCFGMLKGQWRRLLFLNVNCMEKAKQIVECCILLHNFSIRYKLGRPLNHHFEETNLVACDAEVDSSPAGLAKRQSIADALIAITD